MKITRKQLRRIIKESMDDYKQKFDKEYKQPDGSYSGHPDEALPTSLAAKKWVAWGEGFGLQQEVDEEEQIVFYFDMDDDVDGSIASEAESMGGEVSSTGLGYDGNMIIYTGEYI